MALMLLHQVISSLSHVVLNSKKFEELLERLKEYEYIIVDSPPVLLVTDGLILSEKVDTTLFY